MPTKKTTTPKVTPKNLDGVSIRPIVEELEGLFSIFNSHYFGGKLEKPVITVSPDCTKGAYGWCTSRKDWHDKEGSYYEINLCAEHLARTPEAIATTLLHEMVHLYNLLKGVKDNSRSGTYHNTKFKEAAEAHGLTVEKSDKYCYCITSFNADARAFFKALDFKGFELYREAFNTKTKVTSSRQSSRKYVCPRCGLIVRATKEVNIICAECNVRFEEE